MESAHRIAPMIVGGVTALRGNTMDCESRDGDAPFEMLVIENLIAHIGTAFSFFSSTPPRSKASK